MKIIHYPLIGRSPEQVFTQQTFDLLMAQWSAWQQGPGTIGKLHLHACWGEVSVLDKSYQGETVTILSGQMRFLRRLYEKTGNPKWRVMVNAMASHLLFLQDESGGFIHSTAEFEPSFDTRGCPIHFFYPIIALCEYYTWEHADEDIKSLIPDAVDRHWEWSLKSAWGAGNRYHRRPLDFPGWCGVTNQDLVAIGAVALQMKVFGKTTRYEQYALPALNHFLSPAYYHQEIGLFERGDQPNFAERSVYYTHVLEMLELIYGITGDERLTEAYHNVASHLFDAAFTAENGLTYLARGAITDPVDKSRVYGWEYDSIAFHEYPRLIHHLKKHVEQFPSPEKERILGELKKTVAAYVLADGCLPMGLFNPNPLFSVVSGPDIGWWPELIMDELGDDFRDPQPIQLPSIHRTYQNITWKQKGPLWSIEENGTRKYGGYTKYAAGVIKGPEAAPVRGSFATLDLADYHEIIDETTIPSAEK